MSNAPARYSQLAPLMGKLDLHEHICLIYDTPEEQMASAIPYLRAGLQRGEKCIYVADEDNAAAVLKAMREGGTEVESQLRKGALAVISKHDIYLKTGHSDPDQVIGFWTEATAQAKAAGFPGLRILADMTWTLGEHGAPAGILKVESQINHVYHDHDAVGMCQYRRADFSPEVISGVIRTHPLVVYGGLVSKNPYYVPPEEFLKPDHLALEVERLLRNILEAEQAQQTLRRSEERWRSVFANSAIGIALSDPASHRFLHANLAFQKMTGYSEEELRAVSFLEITDEADREANRRLLAELLEGKRASFEMEKHYRRKHGDLIRVVIHVSLVPGSEGVPQFSMAIIKDITEHKRAKEELRRNEERWRAFFSASPAGSAILDSDLRYLQINPTLAEINGPTVEQHLGRTVREVLPRVAPSVEPLLRSVLATGKPVLNVEVSGETPSQQGERRHWIGSFFPVAGPGGSSACVGGVVVEVTELKRAEEEIERLRSQLELERDYLREELNESQAFGEILGRSPALQRVLSQIELVAPTQAGVLILGESGTGKELVARAIHRLSPRSSRPLIKVNCGSIPRELFESEFFGHVKGAFTGALRDRAGRFELADGGTLFLDEVSEIPLELQSKLLRVLQEGEFERVGEESTRHANVRVIAATNRDLQSEVEAGRFRLDLYHRLAVFPIQVPPLRDRREDIPTLAAHFVERFCSRSNLPRPRLRQRDVEALRQYDWPGNVRELQNVIERAVILAHGGPLRFDLPASSLTPQAPPSIETPIAPQDADVLTESQWRERERENLRKALRWAGGRISGPGGAAKILGVHPNTLAYRLRVLGLKK